MKKSISLACLIHFNQFVDRHWFRSSVRKAQQKKELQSSPTWSTFYFHLSAQSPGGNRNCPTCLDRRAFFSYDGNVRLRQLLHRWTRRRWSQGNSITPSNRVKRGFCKNNATLLDIQHGLYSAAILRIFKSSNWSTVTIKGWAHLALYFLKGDSKRHTVISLSIIRINSTWSVLVVRLSVL